MTGMKKFLIFIVACMLLIACSISVILFLFGIGYQPQQLQPLQPVPFVYPSLSTGDSFDKPLFVKQALLYCRTWSGDKADTHDSLIQSMHVFWNWDEYGDLLLVLDNESDADHEWKRELEAYKHIHVEFEDPFSPQTYHGMGHVKQQLSHFFIDRMLTQDLRSILYERKWNEPGTITHVGIVDGDTLFISPQQVESSWNDTTGKPIIVVRLESSPIRWIWWLEAMKRTRFALGLPEVGRCMSYFPVYIRIDHLPLLRRYVETVHQGKSFEQVFQEFSIGDVFSQFNIICTYLWYFHREEYEWRYWKTGPGSVHTDLPESIQDFSFLNQENTRPLVRSAIHYKHHGDNNISHQILLQTAICHLFLHLNKTSPHCTIQIKQPWKDLFEFEQATWMWDQRVVDIYQTHYTSLVRNWKLQHTQILEEYLQP